MLADLNDAIVFALHAHVGQMRKTKGVPFIAHPFAVAMMLQKMGCSHHVIVAALLHDTVEDTSATLDEVSQKFGDEVAGLVACVTEPRGSWEYRKETYIDQIKNAPAEAKILSSADKLHNLHNVYQEQKRVGEAAWDIFSRGKREQAWFYRSVYAGILHNLPSPENYTTIHQLGELIDEMFEE